MIKDSTTEMNWFIGIVEDIDDPQQIGRVRVRIYNLHPADKTLVPTSSLPWAFPLTPINGTTLMGKGQAPVGVRVGATAVGFFADGSEKQVPIVLGLVLGIQDGQNDKHDVNIQARGQNTVQRQQVGPEPGSSYNSRYPFNSAWTTPGGHVIEIDDTPGGERIHVYHKSGTYTEITPEGTRVEKTNGKSYKIVNGEDTVYITGNATITVNGSTKLITSGSFDVNAGTVNIISAGPALIKGSIVVIDGAKDEVF